MKKGILVITALMMILTLAACGVFKDTSYIKSESSQLDLSENDSEEAVAESSDVNIEEGETEMDKITVTVNGTDFTATLEDNEATRELTNLLRENDITLKLSDYSGFEKVGPLGQNLTASNAQTTTRSGDIVLYNGNQIVLFYGSNSWSYTYLAHIEDLNGWEEALGKGDVTVVLSIE